MFICMKTFLRLKANEKKSAFVNDTDSPTGEMSMQNPEKMKLCVIYCRCNVV